MKPLPNASVQERFGIPELEGADAEITVGPPRMMFEGDDVYGRSRGPVMRKVGTDDFRLHVFDRWDSKDSFADRKPTLSRYDGVDGVDLVEHVLLLNQEDLDAYEARMIELGYEGVMIRSPLGRYKYGESTEREGYLLKLKRFLDAEAIILSVGEQQSNTNEATTNELGYTSRSSSKVGKVGKGTFGYFEVKDLTTGVVFTVGNGPGLTQQMRDDLWAIRDQLPGRYITYTYQGVGTVNAPRLPQFKGFRDPIDMADIAA
jgi:DNA ligase-1